MVARPRRGDRTITRGVTVSIVDELASAPIALAILLPALALSAAAEGAPKRPDLVVSRTDAPRAELSGNRIRVTFVAANRGSRKAGQSRVSLGLRSAGGKRVQLDARPVIGSLRAGVVRRWSGSVAVPRVDPGRWTVIVCLDAGRRVRERSEANNCRAAKPAITIAPGARPLPGFAPTSPPAAPAATASPTATASSTTTATPTATATAAPTASPSATPTPEPTATPTPTATPAGPETTIDSGPSGIVATAAATFTFSSPAAGATFECALDAGSWEPCTSPHTVASLADGPHVLAVRAGADPTPAERRWTVDTSAPDTTITGAPKGELDGGPFTFAFAASDAVSRFECQVDTGTWETCESPLRLEAAASGAHTFAVRARDRLDNLDASPATAQWTVTDDDGTRPRASFAYAPTNLTHGDEVTFASTSGPGITRWEWDLYDAGFEDGPAEVSDPEYPLQGTRTVALRVTDATGKQDVSRGQLFVGGSADPAPSGDAATTYQQNAAHDGFNRASTLAPPLAQAWAKDLGGSPSYPLVVGDRIFVIVAPYDRVAELVALNRRSGAELWRKALSEGSFGAAYDDGRVFTVEREGFVRASDAATGATLWMSELPFHSGTAPVAGDGMVYALSSGAGADVVGLDARDGEWVFKQGLPSGDNGSLPALDGDDLFLAYACPGTFGMDRWTGFAQWWHQTGCTGSVNDRTAVVHRDRVYNANRPGPTGLVHDAISGVPVGTFPADGGSPAFAGDLRLQVRGGRLEAHDERAGSVAWTFTGDGALIGAPVIAAGHAFVGSSGGNVYAVRVTDGGEVWQGATGAPVSSSGLAIAQGTLVVPAGNRLVAFSEAPETGGPTATVLDPVDLGPPTAGATVAFHGDVAHTGGKNVATRRRRCAPAGTARTASTATP